MTSYFLTLFFSVSICLSSAAGAVQRSTVEVSQSRANGAFTVGIGSTVEVESQQKVFLGKLLAYDGTPDAMMLLDSTTDTVHYVPTESFSGLSEDFQNVLDLYPQTGDNCTGYALDNFLLQSHFSKFVGTGQLQKDVSTEEGRTSLLADTISQYYLVTQHRFSILGILNQYGKKYGFACAKKTFEESDKARGYLQSRLQTGQPVLIAFYIGPEMTQGPFKLQKGDAKDPEDGRLWLPRKVGARKSGGHAVVATGQFRVGTSDYLVMLDSDWDLPRVWDLNEVFSERTALKEIEFYDCH